MTEQEFLAWAFVKPETHTQITCTCPECGAVFSGWMQNHLVSNPLDREMEEQTTECTRCAEEWEEENEEESY